MTSSDQADADWEADMEKKDAVTDQLFGLQISTPVRARGASPHCWSSSPANNLRQTPVVQRSPEMSTTVESSPSTWSTTSTANSELAVVGPQVLFSFCRDQ